MTSDVLLTTAAGRYTCIDDVFSLTFATHQKYAVRAVVLHLYQMLSNLKSLLTSSTLQLMLHYIEVALTITAGDSNGQHSPLLHTLKPRVDECINTNFKAVLLKGCGMGPRLVLVSPCFRENVIATCKIWSFLCNLDNLLQKHVIVFFFGNQIS